MSNDRNTASRDPLRLACGGHLAMAAALGIGRFVYTPILPSMIDALGWSNIDAGLVASANFLGYLVGALAAGQQTFSAAPRRWMLIALVLSAATTAAMGLSVHMSVLIGLRFIGGLASAFVLICASTLVLEQLSATGRGHLAATHFAGVGAGIIVSAIAVAALLATGAEWWHLWIASGLIAAMLALVTATLIGPVTNPRPVVRSNESQPGGPGIAGMIVAYGLFGFGYVITATFLVTIVRRMPELRLFEPWVWMLFGLAAVPSVPLWQRLGHKIGLTRAYAVACLVAAVGVAACVEWVTVAGVCVTAVLVGGTFMGLTALGLMSGRALSRGQSQRAIGLMTASFGVGQVTGPPVAGFLFDTTGSFRSASLVAAAALVTAAALAFATSLRASSGANPPQQA